MMNLESLVLKRLKTIRSDKINGMVGFPKVFSKVCSTLCLSKKECWDVLFKLQKSKKIKIVPFHGVRIM
jgi:hypothetical protein